MEHPHDVLDVGSDADREELRHAYRTLSKEHHPDQGGSRERFLRIQRAYEEITGEMPPDECEDGGRAITHGSEKPDPDPTFDPAARSQASGPDIGPGHGLRVEGELLSLTLTGLVADLELASIVDRAPPGVRRTIAFFEMENSSDQELSWRGRANTSFIGDDGFMYEGANILHPHRRALPRWWSVNDVDISAGRALNAVVVAQDVPDDVTIEKVIHTQHAGDETERYLFEIKQRARDALAAVPDAFER